MGEFIGDDHVMVCDVKNDHQEGREIDHQQETMEKDSTNIEAELEAKGAANEQALLEIESQGKERDELVILLRKTDSQKEYYINAFEEANARVNELEAVMNHMARQQIEFQATQDSLSRATTDITSAKTEIDGLKISNSELLSQLEEITSALSEEKRNKNELKRQVSDMDEVIAHLKLKEVEAKWEATQALSNKENELEIATNELSEAREQLKVMRDLEARIAEKSKCIDSLELELREVSERHGASQKAVSEALYELQSEKETNECRAKKILEQELLINLMENEMKELKMQLSRVNFEVAQSGREAEEMKTELGNTKEKENNAQVEIALLKFELHKGRSKLAAAEAAEARAQAEKSALYNALHQMGLEAEDTKKENRVLKEAANEEMRSGRDADAVGKDMKREMEITMAKMAELRIRAEQAISRAEAAEKAKAAMEEKIKKRKEYKERRKAALEALREESVSMTTEFGSGDGIEYEVDSRKSYQPLRKVLNMKF